MTSPYHIRYLKRQDIDPVKWDDCIARSSNGLVYAYSFYLDNMARQWDALVWNDYEAVMPLTWNRKWGIRYLYQPPLTQQLGVFFRPHRPDQADVRIQIETKTQPESGRQPESKALPEPKPQLIRAFLDEAARRFRFAEIFLNYKNDIRVTENDVPDTDASPVFTLTPRMNYVLSLAAPYSQLRERYTPALVKNLSAAGAATDPATDPAPLHYTNIFDAAEAIAVYHDTYRDRLPHVKKDDYNRFLKVCRHLEKEGGTLVRAVYGNDKLLLAVTLLLKKKDRIYLILPTTLPEGKTRQANHFLLDQLIREFAGQNLTLDFEGSDLPGIARFYKKFGPTEQPFFFCRFNSLPWPLRLLKNRD